MPDPQIFTFTGSQVLEHKRILRLVRDRLWFIYTWKRNGQTLFVGRTRNPHRALSECRVLGVPEPIEPSDEISFFGYTAKPDADAMLLGTIMNQLPVYNDLPNIHKSKHKLTPEERQLREFLKRVGRTIGGSHTPS